MSSDMLAGCGLHAMLAISYNRLTVLSSLNKEVDTAILCTLINLIHSVK